MGDKNLRMKYRETLESGNVVFEGHPLRFFERMSAKELHNYKEDHPEFANHWAFKAILQDRGPIFGLIAMNGTDKRTDDGK